MLWENLQQPFASRSAQSRSFASRSLVLVTIYLSHSRVPHDAPMRGLEQPRILPFAVHPYLALVGRVNLTVVESFIPPSPGRFLSWIRTWSALIFLATFPTVRLSRIRLSDIGGQSSPQGLISRWISPIVAVGLMVNKNHQLSFPS